MYLVTWPNFCHEEYLVSKMKTSFPSPTTLVVALLVVFQSTVTVSASGDELIFCGSGEYLELGTDGKGESCHNCLHGFNSETMHRKTACEACTPEDTVNHSAYFKVVAPCTAQHDIKLRCIPPGMYFHSLSRSCLLCSNCEATGYFEAVPCSDYDDAICCPRQHMIVRDGECVEPDVFCGPKEYLTQDVQHGDICRLCPHNSTNYESSHRLRSCGETCLSLPDMERLEGRSQVFSRQVECGPNECLIGKSCSSEDTLLCTPCPPSPTTPGEDLDSHKDKGQFYVTEFEIASMIVAIIALLCCILVCLYKSNRCSRSNAGKRKAVWDADQQVQLV